VVGRSPTALLLRDQTSNDLNALAAAQRDRCRDSSGDVGLAGGDLDHQLDRAAAVWLFLDAYSSSEHLVAALPFER
jgi:hypothetical protein